MFHKNHIALNVAFTLESTAMGAIMSRHWNYNHGNMFLYYNPMKDLIKKILKDNPGNGRLFFKSYFEIPLFDATESMLEFLQNKIKKNCWMFLVCCSYKVQ